ncbi:hypothetical protein [Micromonospora sp. NPDC005367]
MPLGWAELWSTRSGRRMAHVGRLGGSRWARGSRGIDHGAGSGDR